MTIESKRSWRRVAEIMAARLINYNYCPNNHNPFRDDCPFCQDMKAYQAYTIKATQVKKEAAARFEHNKAIMEARRKR